MVKLNKIYTRSGDNGTTALVSGPRRVKHDLRIEAYGTVDEANSVIGIARLHTVGMDPLDGMLERIQNDLFDLGADLATPHTSEKLEWEPLRIVASQIVRLENDIDRLNAELSPLTSFVLPGGSAASAHLHLARTIVRRAERVIVALSRVEDEAVGTEPVQYVNRLSDFLFVAARACNDQGRKDVLWVPGKNR
jgi:cob(I)alamin adenosyltransferase